jgi:hypothetical protein
MSTFRVSFPLSAMFRTNLKVKLVTDYHDGGDEDPSTKAEVSDKDRDPNDVFLFDVVTDEETGVVECEADFHSNPQQHGAVLQLLLDNEIPFSVF